MGSLSGVFSLKEILGKTDLNFVNGNEQFCFKGDRLFTIPLYQREIKWKKDRVDNLIDDVFDSGKFIGIIYLNQIDDNRYEVIDGQQRLSVLLMILSKLNYIAKEEKDDSNIFKFIDFNNESFPKFLECIENKFNQEVSAEYDVLNQFGNFKIIWDEIGFKLSIDDYDKICEFREHLLDCQINVLISKKDNSNHNKKMCVEYFIDINNKSVPLDKIDILKAYMFRADYDHVIDSWNSIQKEIRNFTVNGYYNIDNLFLHYFLCQINAFLGDKTIKGINDNYKITKPCNIEINGIERNFPENTDIEEIIGKRASFYKNMLKSCIGFIKYMNTVLNNNCFSDDYKSYFEKFKFRSSIPLENVYHISSDIIRCTDYVPKILLFRYYLDVIDSNTATEDDFKLIYDIGILATVFSTSKSNSKSNSAFAGLMLSKKWKTAMKERAFEHLSAISNKVGYDKNFINSRSAQYLSKRLHAMMYCTKVNKTAKEVKWNPDKFKTFMNDTTYNDEHFIVNQNNNGIVTFKYKDVNYDVLYPITVKSKLNHLANILRIDKDVNTALGNKTIKDKINQINGLDKKVVFEDDLSVFMFDKASVAFNDCPSENDLNLEPTIEDAKKKLLDYYENKFEENYENYINMLKSKKW